MLNFFIIVLSIAIFSSQTHAKHDCSSSNLRVKKDVKYLSYSEKQEIVGAVKALKNVPSSYNSSLNAYDYFVRAHIEALDYPIHSYWLFTPWHRELINRFESELRRVSNNSELSYPYWDLADEESRQKTFSDDFMGPFKGDQDDNWVIKSGPFTADEFPVDPVISESQIPGEFLSHSIVRCGGNGAFLCLSTDTFPVQEPFLLDSAFIDRRILENNPAIFGPFISLFDQQPHFYALDKESTHCNWEDAPNQCKWYFKNETNHRIVCQHYASAPASPESTECLQESYRYSTPRHGPGVPREYFRACLEGVDPADAYHFPWTAAGLAFLPPHGHAHNWVGGSLTNVGTCNDPVFFLLHSNIDRLWAEFQERIGDPNASFSPEQLDTELPLFDGVYVKDVIYTSDLGFTYDTIECPMEPPSPPQKFVRSEGRGTDCDLSVAKGLALTEALGRCNERCRSLHGVSCPFGEGFGVEIYECKYHLDSFCTDLCDSGEISTYDVDCVCVCPECDCSLE